MQALEFSKLLLQHVSGAANHAPSAAQCAQLISQAMDDEQQQQQQQLDEDSNTATSSMYGDASSRT